MRFSVIIPVYQAEKTIARCLDSLLGQQSSDMELLVVNDGSTDESGKICNRYAQQYPCIHYYEKENGGVSSARNLGLDHAQGDYILFVDCDDFVTNDYFRAIEEALQSDAPDLLLFGNYKLDAMDQPLNCHDFFETAPERISEEIAKLMRANRFNSLWIKTFSTQIIKQNRIRFDTEIEIAEDLNFIFAYVMHISSVKAIPKPLYVVDESNADSLSRKARPNLAEQLMHSCLSMIESLDQSRLSKPEKDCYLSALSWLYYRSVYSVAKELHKSSDAVSERRRQLRDICDQYAKQGVAAPGWKNRIIAAPVQMRMARLIDKMAQGRKTQLWAKSKY